MIWKMEIKARYHHTPTELLGSKPCLAWVQSNGSSHPLLVGMQNSIASLEHSLTGYFKTKNSLTIWSSSCTTRHVTQLLRKYISIQNLHMNAHSSFLHNHSKLELTKIFFRCKWVNWYIYTMEYYSVININELLCYE